MTLPMRWQPAAKMWAQGYPLPEIAGMYAMTEKNLKSKLKVLQRKYPRLFRPRIRHEVREATVSRLVYAPTLRERALDIPRRRGRRVHAA